MLKRFVEIGKTQPVVNLIEIMEKYELPKNAGYYSKKYFKRILESAVSSIAKPGKSKKELPKEKQKKGPKIYVFRHGETYDNRNKVFSGHRNSRLTPKGIQQAEILAKKLKGESIDICITSSLSRSKKTAKIALKHHKNTSFKIDDRIIERDYGKLTGKSKVKAMREDTVKTVLYRRSYDFPPPKGESLKMVEKRVFPFCDEITKRAREENINIAISCHGNSMKAIRRYFEKLPVIDILTQENPLAQDYAEYTIK